MKRLILTCITSFTVLYSFAQLDESDTSRLQVRATLTGRYQTGNVELLLVKSRLDLSTQLGKRVVFKSQNKSLYQEFSSRKVDNDLNSRNFLYFSPQSRVYPLAMFFASTNFRRKVDSRYLSGAGLTYQLLRENKQVIKVSFSTFYEETSFDGQCFNNEEFNGEENLTFWRWALYLNGYHRLLLDKLYLHYEGFIEPTYEDAANYRAEFEIGFNYQIWKGLSFTANYIHTYEDLVVDGIEQDDNLITYGLSYSLNVY